MAEKVLITGGTGFVGSHLREELDRRGRPSRRLLEGPVRPAERRRDGCLVSGAPGRDHRPPPGERPGRRRVPRALSGRPVPRQPPDPRQRAPGLEGAPAAGALRGHRVVLRLPGNGRPPRRGADPGRRDPRQRLLLRGDQARPARRHPGLQRPVRSRRKLPGPADPLRRGRRLPRRDRARRGGPRGSHGARRARGGARGRDLGGRDAGARVPVRQGLRLGAAGTWPCAVVATWSTWVPAAAPRSGSSRRRSGPPPATPGSWPSTSSATRAFARRCSTRRGSPATYGQTPTSDLRPGIERTVRWYEDNYERVKDRRKFDDPEPALA